MSLTQRLNKADLNIQIVEPAKRGGMARPLFHSNSFDSHVVAEGRRTSYFSCYAVASLDKKKPGNGSNGDELERG